MDKFYIIPRSAKIYLKDANRRQRKWLKDDTVKKQKIQEVLQFEIQIAKIKSRQRYLDWIRKENLVVSIYIYFN